MLEAQCVDAGYDGSPVLHQISLQVEPGAVVALLGSNGAGKTTLMRVLGGHLRPTGGVVTLDGRRLPALRPESRVRDGIAQVPEGRHLFSSLTVEDNLVLGAFSRRADRTNVDRVYALFPRLAERRRQLAGSMSGGEQQMLAIGRALMSQPKYVLLDEPSLGLAPLVITAIFGHVAALAADGVGVLVAEQNAHAALGIASSVVVLERGRILATGTPAEVAERLDLVKAYLGTDGAEPAPDALAYQVGTR